MSIEIVFTDKSEPKTKSLSDDKESATNSTLSERDNDATKDANDTDAVSNDIEPATSETSSAATNDTALADGLDG